MLLRFAKLAGGLRLLVVEMAPLVATSTAMLSARTAAYLVGFAFGTVGVGWLAIIATLVAVTGFFGFGSNTAECEAYRAQMRAIDDANRLLMANYQIAIQPLIAASKAWDDTYLRFFATATGYGDSCTVVCASSLSTSSSGFLCYACYRDESNRLYADAEKAAGPRPVFPPSPVFQTYPSCSSPDCPPGKKTWVQVLWASRKGNFSDAKGCFIVAYSQDAPDIPPNIEYNPFLPQPFVRSRATSYYLIQGNRFFGVDTNNWKNLESVSGWDKGYWRAESTDPECRGWRPGWSQKVK